MNSSGTITATNTYGLAGLISRYTSSGSTFYEFDPQGTVSERLNSSGAPTSSTIADAFGNVVNSATVSDPFGYEAQQGYYTDQSTGLILTTFRYYDPGAGRFLNRDPISYSGGMNVYGYCGNGATRASDPSGLNWRDIVAGIGRGWQTTGLALAGIAVGMEGTGTVLDITVVGAPAGVVVNISGAVAAVVGGALALSGTGIMYAVGEGGGNAANDGLPAELRQKANTAFRNNSKLSDMTEEEREAAAKGYDKVAQRVGGEKQALARRFNIERARFLRGERPTLPDRANYLEPDCDTEGSDQK
jgi:RHS repeat-associated protein